MLVDEKLYMSQQTAPALSEIQSCPGPHQKERDLLVNGSDCAPLLCPHVTPYGMLHPALIIRALGSFLYHKNDPREGTLLLRGQAEVIGLFSLEKRSLLEDLMGILQYANLAYRRAGERAPLTRACNERDKEEMV